MESPLRWKPPGGFGKRSEETDRSKDRHRASDRLHTDHRPHRTLGQAAPLRPLPRAHPNRYRHRPTTRPAQRTDPRVSARRIGRSELLAPTGWRPCGSPRPGVPASGDGAHR